MRAYTYFGMAVLVNLAPKATKPAAAIATVVTEGVEYTAVLSDETANGIARDLISDSNLANLPLSPPPYQAPLVSILTSKQLAGLARMIAMSTGCDARLAISEAAFSMSAVHLGRRLFTRCLGPCRSKGLPVCFCQTVPLRAAQCRLYLLPGV